MKERPGACRISRLATSFSTSATRLDTLSASLQSHQNSSPSLSLFNSENNKNTQITAQAKQKPFCLEANKRGELCYIESDSREMR